MDVLGVGIIPHRLRVNKRRMEERRRVVIIILMAPGDVASMPASQHNLVRWSTNPQYRASARLWGVYQGIVQNIQQLSGYTANSVFLVDDDTTSVAESYAKASEYARANGLSLGNYDRPVESDAMYDVFILFQPNLWSSLKRLRGENDDEKCKTHARAGSATSLV